MAERTKQYFLEKFKPGKDIEADVFQDLVENVPHNDEVYPKAETYTKAEADGLLANKLTLVDSGILPTPTSTTKNFRIPLYKGSYLVHIDAGVTDNGHAFGTYLVHVLATNIVPTVNTLNYSYFNGNNLKINISSVMLSGQNNIPGWRASGVNTNSFHFEIQNGGSSDSNGTYQVYKIR